MNIKKFLLSCLAFSSISYTQGFGSQLIFYSDGPIFGASASQNNHTEGLFLNCMDEGADKIDLLDEKVKEIIGQEKFDGHGDFKSQVTEISKLSDPKIKLETYMSLIGLTWANIPSFLSAKQEGLMSYAQTLEGKAGLPTDLGLEVLIGLQLAINNFLMGGTQQAEKV